MQYESRTSDEPTHFLGRRCGSGDERYRSLVKILRGGQLRPSGISGASEDTLELLSIVGNKGIADETAIQG
jgi:hypothetical protein